MRVSRSAPAFARARAPFHVLALAVPVFWAFCPAASAADPDGARLVVVLYPDNSDGSPGKALADQAIRSTFATATSLRVEIYNEYLGVSRSADRTFVPVEVLQRLDSAANAPIYGHVDSFVGHGILGGRPYRFLTVSSDPDYVQAAVVAGTLGYVVKNRLVSDLLPCLKWVVAGRSFVSPFVSPDPKG